MAASDRRPSPRISTNMSAKSASKRVQETPGGILDAAASNCSAGWRSSPGSKECLRASVSSCGGLCASPASASPPRWRHELGELVAHICSGTLGAAREIGRTEAEAGLLSLFSRAPGHSTGCRWPFPFLGCPRCIWFVVALPCSSGHDPGLGVLEKGGRLHGPLVTAYGIASGPPPPNPANGLVAARPPGPAAVQFWSALLNPVPATDRPSALWRGPTHPWALDECGDLAGLAAVFANEFLDSQLHGSRA